MLPFLGNICYSFSKEASSSQKLSKGGIPLANGDALLQKPPPWAYPLWTAQEAYRNSNERMSRSTAQAIDQAMTHVSEAKIRIVRVNLSVERQSHEQLEKTNVDPHDVSWCSASAYREGIQEMARPGHDNDVECVRVVLKADPGVRMEDIEDPAPRRRKEHRRVPSTVALEEVKVGLSVIFMYSENGDCSLSLSLINSSFEMYSNSSSYCSYLIYS